jgi:serine/threonine protein kinase
MKVEAQQGCIGAEEALLEGPAELLVGLLLNQKWLVHERLAKDSADTGQTRSACYQAIAPDGNVVFVKAFDFRQDDKSGDTERLERNVREFNHERKIHEFCQKLSRVTKIHGSGTITVEEQAVHFIVCEFAPRSFRALQPPGDPDIPAHERLYGLRKIASALVQLHGAGVAHQDVKPSNAVCFEDKFIKIADLGSSSCLHLPSPPHDDDQIVGQPSYAPYELLYPNAGTSTWQRRRFGCDAFLLGNLIFTAFVGASLTVAVLHGLDEKLRPDFCTCIYEELLPDLIIAHHALVPEFLGSSVPEVIKSDLIRLVMALTHPDPAKRGLSPGIVRGERNFDLHRCVGTLNTLARRAELDLGRKANLDRSAA